MKNILSKFRFLPEILLLRIFLVFLRIYHKLVLNTYIDVRECIRGAIYLEAFRQFPVKKFSEVETLVNSVFMSLLLNNEKELDNEEILLLNGACDDGLLLRMISDAHHLNAFSVYILIVLNSDREKEYRDKLDIALSYDDSSEIVTRANFTSYQKKYKRLHKKLKKQVKAHQRNQIKSEVFDEMPTLKISLAAIASVVALVSTLLYIGGYLYSKIFFDILDTDYTLYFGPVDYLSTSLKTTTSILAMTAIGSVFIFLVIYDLKTVKRAEYHYDQTTHDTNDIVGEFEIENGVARSALSNASSTKKTSSEKIIRQWDIYFGLAAIAIVVFSFFSAYISESSLFEVIRFPLMLLVTVVVAWSGVLHIFPQPLFALFILVLTINFSFSVISKGIKDANDVLSGKCSNNSKLELKEDRSTSDDICLLKATDSWVIFYDNQTKSTVAYPREEISFVE